jgi:hypothetical protein
VADADQLNWAKRARTHRFSGVIGLCLAVASVFLFGLVPALCMAVLGMSNLTAAAAVEQSGEVPRGLRIAMIVSGVGFVGSMLWGGYRAYAGH